jgi:para-aminobenzoate synthetase component 1
VPGSVEVQELFGLYTFARLHQIITTVQGQLAEPFSFDAMLKATFPMGSMTGAPKKKALELIAETEAAHRGFFSGAFGYILPNGDFDLSVIIRSLFMEKEKLHYSAGGAIVWDSTPPEEYAESLLKMEGMRYASGQLT